MMHFSRISRIVTRPLRAALARFRRDEGASLSVEAVIVVPLLVWAFAATFTFFDVFRVKSVALKANYAISDLLSRETGSVNETYMLGTEALYEFITNSDTSAWMRVTVLGCTADCDLDSRTLSVDWSYGTESQDALTDTDIANSYDSIIPVMGLGEKVIMVETNMTYEPPFATSFVGISEQDFKDTVLTRPRFVDNLPWSSS